MCLSVVGQPQQASSLNTIARSTASLLSVHKTFLEPRRFDHHETSTNTEPFVSTCLVQSTTQLAIIAHSADASGHYILTSYASLTAE
jgi:histidine ammonia-lyase